MIDTRISALGPRIQAIAAKRAQVTQASRDVAAQLGRARPPMASTAPALTIPGQAQP